MSRREARLLILVNVALDVFHPRPRKVCSLATQKVNYSYEYARADRGLRRRPKDTGNQY